MVKCLLHFGNQIRACVGVTGMGVNQACVVHEGAANEGEDSGRKSRHKSSTAPGCSDHVNDRSTHNSPTSRSGAVALAKPLERNIDASKGSGRCPQKSYNEVLHLLQKVLNMDRMGPKGHPKRSMQRTAKA